MTEIFKESASGVKTHRDHFIVGFTNEEILQKLRVFTGNLADELVKESLDLKDTRGIGTLKEAREEARKNKSENRICAYAYRPFDDRKICYDPCLIDRGCDRWPFMGCLLQENFGIAFKRSRFLKTKEFHHIFVVDNVGDINFYGDQTAFFLSTCTQRR